MLDTLPQPPPASSTPASPRKTPPSLAQRVKLRTAYVHGEGHLTDLCKLHGINYHSARNWHDDERWPALRKQWLERQNQALASEVIPLPSVQPPPQPTLSPTSSKLQSLENQLSRIDEALDHCSDPKGWDMLTRSKDRLLANYFILAGIAKPTARKEPRQRRLMQAVAPLPFDQPAGVGPAAPHPET